MTKKPRSVGQSIGGIVAGIDQQIFRTTPPAQELVAKGARLLPVAAAGGGTITVRLPDDPDPAQDTAPAEPGRLHLSRPGVDLQVDLVAGGRISSFVVDGRELLLADPAGPFSWGSFPMAPFAGRIRDGAFEFGGRRYQLPTNMPPHAIHGTVLDRPWVQLDDRTIATELGPSWPFKGRAIQTFELEPGRLSCRLELHADEPMPASIGWHPWFRRHPLWAADGVPGREPGALELEFAAAAMFRRDAAGIATSELVVPPPPPPWDDCFTDVRRPSVLRWPGFLELTIDSDCPTWVVYTVPVDALCVEPQTAPPDALNSNPTIVEPDRPLTAEMTWTWRSPGS